MLWHVQGTKLHLLGSIHVWDKPEPPISDAARAVYAGALRVVFESNPTEAVTLHTHLRVTSSLWERLKMRCAALNLPVENLAPLCPSLAATTLMWESVARNRFIVENGVEYSLRQKAAGRDIQYLESRASTFAIFENAPMAEQLRLLEAIVDADRVAADFELLRRGWSERKPSVLLELQAERLALCPELFGALLLGRNQLWLPKLLKYAKNDVPTVAVVGVLHMVGDQGIPALFKAEARSVTPVDH